MSPEFREVMRYGSALRWWYARMFSAARRGEEFNEPEPQPSTCEHGCRLGIDGKLSERCICGCVYEARRKM